ncbi:MAG TPA: YihY/virulence factor BrkB family protein [Kineosporiaceae bacterium]
MGFPLSVTYKYLDDQGGFLAALITYYGFLSLFPALLLLVTALGYFLAGNVQAQRNVLDSALAQFPVVGLQLEQNVSALHGSAVAVVVGSLGLLYGALGIGQAAQLAFNRAWAVPRNERPDALRSRLRSLLFVLLIGAGLIAATILTGLGAATGTLDSHIGVVARLLVLCVAVVTNVSLFVVAFRLLTARDVTVGDLLPGAAVAACGWQLLQVLGATYVSRVVARSMDIYGAFGIVLGLLAWIYLGATVTVLAAEVNVVRACRLWPRSLLAPFTDGLPLTPADKRAYVSYVEMRRHKRAERIGVSFEDPPP